MAILPILLLALCLLIAADAFQIQNARQKRSYQTSSVDSIIRPDAADFEFDEGSGGVRLATESVIKITGSVKHSPGSATPAISDLIRHRKLHVVPENKVMECLAPGSSIVCTGIGKGEYKDPGETTEALVTMAPLDAVRDALMGAGSAMKADSLVINFAGGDDAEVLEVMEAVKLIVLDLDVVTKCKISFNSISASDFAVANSFLTVVGLPEGASSSGRTGVEKALASGEVYFSNGKYYTLSEEDINIAVA